MRRIRQHLTYANVTSTLCLFLLLGGGTAVALNGTNTVQSDDLGPGAQVKAPDVADNAVNSADVVNESLTGADIKNRSGVETCKAPLTAKYGPLCVGSDGGSRFWQDAEAYCTDLGLRVPSVSEAVALAKKYDVPGVASGNSFWTDAYYPATVNQVSTVGSVIVSEDGYRQAQKDDGSRFGTVCVTDPSA